MIYGLSATVSPIYRTIELILGAGVMLFAVITIIAWGITGLQWAFSWWSPAAPKIAKSRASGNPADLAAYAQGVTARLGDVTHYSNELTAALESLRGSIEHNEQQTRYTRIPLTPELVSPAEIAQDREKIEHAETKLFACLSELEAFLFVPPLNG
jgi:hypothetical protein